ncbi:hypothetical protein YC2023_055172 [Brassica napus]
MGLERGCKSTPNYRPSRASCHRHTSDSDQTSYFGMVARTICKDSVLNHRSKLSWMKCQSTNCQRQVAIDITYRHERTITIKSSRVDVSSRYHVMPETCEQSE